MRIFLLGLPGSGKGVQGALLESHLGIPHISIGDRVRLLADGRSALGKTIQRYHNRSKQWRPLPDDLAFAVFNEVCQPHCIVDGFPRNVEQLKLLNPQKSDIFVHLHISDEVSRDRVLSRQRGDDALSSWKTRIEVERSRLNPLVFTSGAITVFGENAPHIVFERIKDAISI